MDRKKVIRIAGLAVSTAGLAVAGSGFLRFVRAVAGNAIEGGPALTRYAEYYRQVGHYYARGFTTGFFVCYFLMMLAVIAGSWLDEVRRARRAARATPSAASRSMVATPP
ncbi:MAG: hypothetical protein AUH92_00735 [Acidobacteria bacterium 13_1_40CM_4_69_4]|nr:MAG: hypothetical protein AUH92_00735 [Acidobacteria bacterium 13_1_40CM_4_69_4]